jgi:hypothetical protein
LQLKLSYKMVSSLLKGFSKSRSNEATAKSNAAYFREMGERDAGSDRQRFGV